MTNVSAAIRLVSAFPGVGEEGETVCYVSRETIGEQWGAHGKHGAVQLSDNLFQHRQE
jgi:hypothetical protein